MTKYWPGHIAYALQNYNGYETPEYERGWNDAIAYIRAALSASSHPAAVREVTDEMVYAAMDAWRNSVGEKHCNFWPQDMRAALEAALATPEAKP